jgi:hypothetical protein
LVEVVAVDSLKTLLYCKGLKPGRKYLFSRSPAKASTLELNPELSEISLGVVEYY